MRYLEVQKDLFTIKQDCYYAQCISADFGMGKGIAVDFNKHFNMKNKLRQKYPDYSNIYVNKKLNGDCILEGRVFNLITKEKYYYKPTYKSIENALNKMKELAIKNNIKNIAMPMIGCGLDKLKWENVSYIIKKTFNNTDINIAVCVLKNSK